MTNYFLTGFAFIIISIRKYVRVVRMLSHLIVIFIFVNEPQRARYVCAQTDRANRENATFALVN